jgi:hypothetical protein
MSLHKKKQIAEFLSKSADEKQVAISHPDCPPYNSALYKEAELLRANLYQWHYFLVKDRETSRAASNSAAQYLIYVDQLLNHFHAAYKSKAGSFFRALADALERRGNSNWSKREKFIFAICSSEIGLEQQLPTPGQLLKGWKIYCGMMPSNRRDLVFLWEYLLPGTSPPINEKDMKEKLRPLLPIENAIIGDVQITQIQRDAKNVGFILPTEPKGKGDYLPPIGIGLMVIEKDNIVF